MPFSNCHNQSQELENLGYTAGRHGANAARALQRLRSMAPATTCKDAVNGVVIAERAKKDADASGNVCFMQQADRLSRDMLRQTQVACLERKVWADGILDGLGKVEYLNTRGYRDGSKAWIDVIQPGGRKMRISHEVLEGLHGALGRCGTPHARRRGGLSGCGGRRKIRGLGSTPPPLPAAARKCIAWREVKGERRCALYRDESEPSVHAFAGAVGLEGVGSSLALMWAAAGAVALIALSDAQNTKMLARPADPARELILKDLNRARVTQGLPPLPG